jgi:N,N-dimethylformamidase
MPPAETPREDCVRLMGYLDRLSVAAGQTLEVKVSAAAGPCEARVVRLGGVDVATDRVAEGPVPGIDPQTFPGRVQPLHPGSFAFAAAGSPIAFGTFGFELHVMPTLPDRDRQTLLAVHAEPTAASWTLDLTRHGLELRLGSGEGIRLPARLAAGRWMRITGGRDRGRLHLAFTLHARWPVERGGGSAAAACPAPAPARLVAASIGGFATDPTRCRHPFNGRIENPRIVAAPPAEGETPDVLVDWDFALDMSARRVRDVSPSGLHAVLVNRPERGVRSHGWTGEVLRYREDPRQWAAVHFHEDDLEDAGWGTDVRFRIPEDTPSGIYAVRLAQGGAVEHLPFYVRPTGRTDRRVLFVAPTNTYLAYANDHLGEGERGAAHETRMRDPIVLDDTDRYVFAHRELGLSLYDRHSDGSGVCYSSWRRPVLNFRPNRITWLNAGRRHLAADFYITGWLESLGVGFDVATDADVHREGASLLGRYDVVVSGSHPEYPTSAQLDALEAFVAGGGNVLYLGGNGWYWVTSYDDEDASVIECRRGYAGERNWTSHPAELDHSSTGEVGGLYAHRGRSSRLLFGVASAAVGWGTASGYVRQPASHDPEVAPFFEGIDGEVVGDFGLVLDGAAGDELDSADYAAGTPAHAKVLMSSRHDDTYFPFLEQVTQVLPNAGGPTNPAVRSDVVYIDTGAGRILSVGSICWAGALAYDGYRNSVARFTANVLRSFLGPRR